MVDTSSQRIEKFDCKDSRIKIISTHTNCSMDEVDSIIEKLDSSRGVMLTSRYEYPGRYTRWDIGFVNPPIVIESIGDKFSISALNKNGEVLIPVFKMLLEEIDFVKIEKSNDLKIECGLLKSTSNFLEEDRSKLPHVVNVLRHLRDCLAIEDDKAGFYGAFGYDLGVDFMGVTRSLERNDTRDLVLYLADELYITDHEENSSYKVEYEFEHVGVAKTSVEGRGGSENTYQPIEVVSSRDMAKGEYSEVVEVAKEYFARGDLFEVVPSQTFHEQCFASPATVFNQLLEVNPAPYGALINLGENEWTVSASPEMYVRVEGSRVESCPIAGTIARGSGDISDAQQIEKLLASEKEKSELTMCTDVDRNDKSRVCMPETIQVIGRRQIELYSRLIHTVDHVEAHLEEGYDSIDAFLTHMWAVTVTGAPKLWAMNFIEKFEKSPRRFYGGSMGFVGLNGSMNTGLMLRTVHFANGQAHIRVGATLLADSNAQEEEKETELKASAMLDVVRFCNAKALGENPISDKMHAPTSADVVVTERKPELDEITDEELHAEHALDENARLDKPEVLLIDCEDSFVHTLAGYFRMCGATVHTRRVGFTQSEFEQDIKNLKPNLICLSPGPGSPSEFGLSWIIEKSRQAQLPIFGVCLGLQALVEYFGGELEQLDTPMHGKPSNVVIESGDNLIFEGIESPFQAGRYHSLIANIEKLPKDLKVTARTQDDGVIMAVEHNSEPIAAVQFHPESIMTMDNQVGPKIIQNVIDRLAL
jgi:anthranilate synthase